MKTIDEMKKYSTVLILVAPLLVLVFLKSFTPGHFKNDAEKWAAPSVDQSNLLSSEQLNSLPGKTLMVNLGSDTNIPEGVTERINTTAQSILDKDIQTILHSHKGNIILVSDDPALSARMWMLLSQMGYKKLYILSDSVDNEVLKYKFQPDSATRPEL
jgi:hypothetical protein